MIEPGDHVVVLLVDDTGHEQEIHLFATWADGKRAFTAALKEFENITFDVQHTRGHWWACRDEGDSSHPWVELSRIKVE